MSDLLKVRVGGSDYLCKWEEPNTVEIGGREYRTVKIGNQEWLAENLDYKWTGLDIGPSGTPSAQAAWYYNNDESTYGANGNKYGLLYNWWAVNYLSNHLSELMVPEGWHVPSKDEIQTLISSAGGSSIAGKKLKSTTGWSSGGNGTDDYGFSLVPSSNRDSGGSFGIAGDDGSLWTSTEYNNIAAYYLRCSYYTNETQLGDIRKNTAFSIRLVRTFT